MRKIFFIIIILLLGLMVFKGLRKDRTVNSTEPNDYTVWVDTEDKTYNMPKITTEGFGSVSFTVVGGGGNPDIKNIDIVHNLGYKPQVMAYVNFLDYSSKDFIAIPCWTPGTSGTYEAYITHVDDDTVRIVLIGTLALGVADTTADYKYFLLVDPIKDVWY